MGKRYFCDFCQRSFVDDIDSRKKHLNSVSHLRIKKEHYAQSRDLKTLIEEERKKEICRRYRNTGDCPFGVICNHTHYTEAELDAFEKIVQEEERIKLPNVDDWLRKITNKNSVDIPIEMSAPELPTSPKPSLPPSLRFPSVNEMRSVCLTEWG